MTENQRYWMAQMWIIGAAVWTIASSASMRYGNVETALAQVTVAILSLQLAAQIYWGGK